MRKHITGKNVEEFIKSKSFSKLDDDDAVSLCCIGILQLVLIGRSIATSINGMQTLEFASLIGPSEVDKKFEMLDKEIRRVPEERLIPDEIEAGFDFQEQRSGLDQMMKQGQFFFEKMNKFMEDMSVWQVEKHKERFIVDQYYGISDLSGFQSIQVVGTLFQTSTNNTFFNMGTPINRQTPRPSQPGSFNWQSQMPAYTPTPNWQPSIPLHPGDAGLCDPNKLDRPMREQRPSVYMQSPYTPLPPTTKLPKKRVGKTKKKCKNDNLSPLNLGSAFAYDNSGGGDVVITGVHDTGIYFTYENVDPNKLTRPDSMSDELVIAEMAKVSRFCTPVVNDYYL
ncbi:hypothetical protein Tco_1237959 [Tanacetum coccineum]